MRYLLLFIFLFLSLTVKAQFCKLHFSLTYHPYARSEKNYFFYDTIDLKAVYYFEFFGVNPQNTQKKYLKCENSSDFDVYCKNLVSFEYFLNDNKHGGVVGGSRHNYLLKDITYQDFIFNSFYFEKKNDEIIAFDFKGLVQRDTLKCDFSYKKEPGQYLCPQNIKGGFTFKYPDLKIEVFIEADGREISWNTLTNVDYFNIPFNWFENNGLINKKFNIVAKAEDIELGREKNLIFYDNYPLDDNQLYVVDNKLHTSLAYNDKLTIISDFIPKDSKQISCWDLNNKGFVSSLDLCGSYRITFTRPNYCIIERDVLIPEVQYNKVNKSDNEFWYVDDKREAVILKAKYPDGNYSYDFRVNNKSTYKIHNRKDGKIAVRSLQNSSDTVIKECVVDSVPFFTDKDLKSIDMKIYSKDKKFVPVHINLNELKYYPNITAEADVKNPHCNYNDAILKINKLQDGLGKKYSYLINGVGDTTEIKSDEIILDKSLTDFYVEFFDAESKLGRKDRSLKIENLSVSRPQSMEFLDTVSTHLSCYHDKTGSFEVNKVQLSYPEKAVTYNWYKFPYSETDKLSISESVAEGLAAGNYIVVVENNKCKDTAYFTLSEPEFPLEISKDTVKNPVCFGYSNGRIITHTTGGTQPYTYSWNTGSQDTAIYNLKAGTYILSVTDSHGCKNTATQELVDPEELQNSLTPSHTICKNGELKIDEGDLKSEDLHYSWLLPNQMVHNERVLVVKSDMPEGNYVMISQDTSGCFTADTTNIKFSDNELNIKFLAPTYSYLGDTVVLAEDSEVYKNFSWSYVFNEDMFTDITSSMSGAPYNHTFLESFKYGSDTITMYANDGRCNASYSKVVNILNEQRSDYSDYNAPSAGIFTRLAIGPSPNDGNFTLYANLTEEAALDVFILDLQTALKIPLKYDFKFVSDHYAIPVHNLNLLKGVYALFVTANGDTKYIKFTIK